MSTLHLNEAPALNGKGSAYKPKDTCLKTQRKHVWWPFLLYFSMNDSQFCRAVKKFLPKDRFV
jgi:hypothetical protein